MKKSRVFLIGSAIVLAVSCFYYVRESKILTGWSEESGEYGEENESQNLLEKYAQEFEQMKDPALNFVPSDRLLAANQVTKNMRSMSTGRISSLSWTERGPIYDSLGPSNTNGRGGYSYTSGMIPTFLVDTLNDATGNTVFAGSPGGGLWKCTNFLATSAPNWQPVNDYMANLAIASLCQDPSNSNIMYLATGDGNTRDVRGFGIWKSTDKGTTWNLLPSTTGFTIGYKILCDASGNVYFGSGGNGLRRSNDGGTTWTLISPSGIAASNPSYVTDVEMSSTGRLHATFGYLGTIVKHYYTDVPATVTSAAGWNLSTGIRLSGTTCTRLELATQGNILYAITSNGSYNIDSSYKSVDGGATWTKQNASAYTTSLGSGQGYYNITLQINPSNPSEFIAGGLDAYKSVDNGQTISKITNWVSVSPYVHADHHYMQWYRSGSESRIIIASDGGMFVSRDGGITWRDRNQNLGIKQFYSCAIHPAAGSPYLLGGAQDNGTHQLKNPGLSYSFEVAGGDGAFVHINQQNPNVQFGSYIFNQYRRSTDGGQTWTSINPSTTTGYFINPFDYDDAQNIMYASDANTAAPNNTIRRWPNANTSSATSTVVIAELNRGANSNASSFKVSPYTANRVYIGGSTGKLLRLDNANSVTSANESSNITDLTGASFPTGYLNCINTGTSDQYLVAVFSNYGVNNVWYSADGGSSWTAIDGNLPDMPIWWAAFEPGTDNRLILATESGVFTTQNISGAATVWAANPAFPVVRTTMLKVRSSDNTIVASTYGRGLFTAVIPASLTPDINFTTPASGGLEEELSASGCRGYRDYTVNVSIVNPPTGDATVTYSVQGGSTATQGQDFDFTTNGDFSSPSSQHVFTSGATGVKKLTIRIYDDAEVENSESFTLAFSISGATDAQVGTSSATHVFTIKDNDKSPLVNQTISASFGSNNAIITQPFRGQFSDARTQMVVLASELTAAGLSAGNITSFSLNVTTKASTAPYNGFTVKMKNTSTASMSGGGIPFESGGTVVYGPVNYSTTAGINTFTLSTPFAWDGVSNLMVEFCFDNVTGTATDNIAGTSGLALCQFDRTDGGSGCSMANATFQFAGGARPDISFTVDASGTAIATLVNTSGTEYEGSNSDQYFYAPGGEILARVKNLGAHDYGCMQVVIDRDGTAAGGTPFAKPFWNNIPANYLTAKTWHVIPTTNNSSGQYTITLYFTAAEKAGWEAATGALWNTIKIIKVPSQISNYSPATPAPDGPGAVEIVDPVFGTFGNNYTLSYTFNSGFSGFAAGVPGLAPLPVNLVDFKGSIEKGNAILKWTTLSEQNSQDFEIEKSTDGQNYYTIGKVNASGNSSARKDYMYVDTRLSASNYYRLKMNDADGESKRSQVVLLRYDVPQQQFWVMNNPFRDYIDMRFARNAERVQLQLVNASGSILSQRTFLSVSGQLRWHLPATLGNGSYILKVIADGKLFTSKLVRQ